MFHSRVVAAAAAAVAALAFAAPAAANPPTLTGQVIASDISNCVGFHPGDIATPGDPCIDLAPENVNAQCDPAGTSHLDWDVTGAHFPGTASPYPGVFTEQGNATIGPQDQPPIPPGGPFGGVLQGTNYVNAGPLNSFSATFAIDSPSTGATVTGVKVLMPSPTGNYGACRRADHEVVPGFPPGAPSDFAVTGYFKIANADHARYTALIRTADGVYADRGTTVADVREVFAYAGESPRQMAADVGVVAQTFQSDLEQTELVAPVDKQQCKDGRWAIYTNPKFKNQGDCVSWVATGGRNPAAG